MPRRKLLTCALTLLLGMTACLAEAGADERAEKRAKRAEKRAKRVEALRLGLRSGTPATVAQAAFEAGGLYRSRDLLLPNLIEALKSDSWSTAPHGGRVIKHLLDALIRLDAKVPMALLIPHDRTGYTRTEVLVLAARNGEAARPLLRRVLARAIDRHKIKIAGIAAGNLLASAKDKQLAVLFLPHLQPVVKITVRDHDRLRGGSTIGSSGTGCARCTIPDGFPPAVWYELSFRGRDWQRSLVAKGSVESVWHVRRVEERRKFFGCHSARTQDATEVSLGWAAMLLGVGVKKISLKRRYYGHHRWTDMPSYLAYIQGKRQEVERDGATLLTRLRKAGLLADKARAAVTIQPFFEVKDDRDDKSKALPLAGRVSRR